MAYSGLSDQSRPVAKAICTGNPEKVTVKWYRADKGFGFVTDSNGEDLFIHISTVKNAGLETLLDGQELVVRRGPGKQPGKESANEIILN
jgi:CspA family cold shock protein